MSPRIITDKKPEKKKFKKFIEKRNCRFCEEKLIPADYKDLSALQKSLSPQAKLLSRKRSGNCTYHQRVLQVAVKRARFLSLLPYVS